MAEGRLHRKVTSSVQSDFMLKALFTIPVV